MNDSEMTMIEMKQQSQVKSERLRYPSNGSLGRT
jgi:hypothetical protein